MKHFYLIRPIGYSHHYFEEGLWNPWYDKTFGFVVAADNAREARIIASESDSHAYFDGDIRVNPWMYSKYTTCVIMKRSKTSRSRVIMQDTRSA